MIEEIQRKSLSLQKSIIVKHGQFSFLVKFPLSINLESYLKEFIEAINPVNYFQSNLEDNSQISLIIDGELYKRALHYVNESKSSFFQPFKGIIGQSYSINQTSYFKINEEIYVTRLNNIFCIFPSESDYVKRIALRVIREVLYRDLENRSYFSFHGSACRFLGKTIIFIGEKGTGKTSALFHCLEQGAEFIANDRILISKQLLCDSLPLPIRVSHESISAYPKLSKNICKNLTRSSQIESLSKKIELTPLEINKIYKSSKPLGGEELKVDAIFFPKIIEGDKRHSEIKMIDKNEAISDFKNNCFTPHDENWIDVWLYQRKLSPDKLEKNSINFFLHLMEFLPIYRYIFSYKGNAENFLNIIKSL